MARKAYETNNSVQALNQHSGTKRVSQSEEGETQCHANEKRKIIDSAKTNFWLFRFSVRSSPLGLLSTEP